MMSSPCMESHSLLPSSIAAPLEIAYAGTSFSHAPASTAPNELSTYIHELGEACLSNPFASSAAPLCRKRRALSDLTQEFSQFDGWMLSDEVGLPQLINEDPLQALSDDQATNPSVFTTSHMCSDLEDVLNFLWMEDDTESTTQSASISASVSASSPLACSDRVSLISDLDLDYGANDSSSNQAESNDKPLSDNLQTLEVNQEGVNGPSSDKESGPIAFNWESLQKKEAHGSQLWASLQHKKFEAIRGSWQGGKRASWQDEIRASWQPKQEGGRESWQTEGEIRASWQLQKKEGQNRTSWQAQGIERCGKEERGEGEVSASEKQSVDASCCGGVALKCSRSGGAWAGPTLLDIESALALNDHGSPHTASPLSSFSPIASPTPALSTPHHSLSSFFDVKKLLSDDPTRSSGEQDTLDSSWRLKLQKRNSQEPKYSVKVESEEKAMGDGYRWRKYGQKSIKNSPFPRSYYRCSSGKCNAKKQVEKCQEDARMFLVTYEGIHLHHRPNPLHKFRTLCDLHEDEKEKSFSTLYSLSSTSCSYSISPTFSASSNHTLLT